MTTPHNPSHPKLLLPSSIRSRLWHLSDLFYRGLGRFKKLPGIKQFRSFVHSIMSQLWHNNYLLYPYLDTYQIWACPYHSMDRKVVRGNTYEPEIQKIIAAFVTRGYSYIDIGANIGQHVLAATKYRVADDQSFFAFEPEPLNFAVLEANLVQNGLDDVKTFDTALGETEQIVQLNISTTPNKGNHSLFRDDNKHGALIDIKMTRLDTVFSAPESRPTLLKIDVEGAEIQVLSGGCNFFSSLAEAAMIIEFHPGNLRRANSSVEKLHEYLQNDEFRMYTINDDGRVRLLRDLPTGDAYINVLAVRGTTSEQIAESLLSPIVRVAPQNSVIL